MKVKTYDIIMEEIKKEIFGINQNVKSATFSSGSPMNQSSTPKPIPTFKADMS